MCRLLKNNTFLTRFVCALQFILYLCIVYFKNYLNYQPNY